MGSVARTIADRLRQARRSRFVGRDTELELFDAAMRASPPESRVLFVYGPGGIGKTALLESFADLANEADRLVSRLDARDFEPTPAAFLDAVGEPVVGQILMIDTYELLAPLDDCLRGAFLPTVSADVLVVIAGRNPPTTPWLADPGWQQLVRVVPLRNLRPAECRKLLSARGVPDTRHGEAVSFTHGHPLALALVADLFVHIGRSASPQPERDPDIVEALLRRFTDQVPSPRHRAALEACAHVRVVTEDLLAELLDGVDGADGADLFDWLRGLSFIERGPEGIFPHDLARDVLEADLRWRNPRGYRRLHDRARAGIMRRVQTCQGAQQRLALLDFLFMYRHNEVVGSRHDWETLGKAYCEPAKPGDRRAILEMVELHEGGDSAAIAERWYAVQPDGFTAMRTFDGELIGFEATLTLHDAGPGDLAADPAAGCAFEFARRHGPLRADEQMIYHRFYMTREAYQLDPVALNLRALVAARHWLTRPRLAWSLLAVADARYWTALYSELNFLLSPKAGFRVGGRDYAVFVHDWRVEPALAWFEAMAERELPGSGSSPQPPPLAAPLVVLSEPAFRQAVRQALRDFTRPSVLADSPLVRSRLVVEHPRASGADALRDLILQAATTLLANPRDHKLHKAIRHTYLEPLATQELAAQRLGLPFSTYRAHLAGGIERITGWLWQRELSGGDQAETE